MIIFENKFAKNIFYIESPLQLICILNDLRPEDQLIIRPSTAAFRDRIFGILKDIGRDRNQIVYFSKYKLVRALHILMISFIIIFSTKKLICIGDCACKVAKIVYKIRRFKPIIFYDDGGGAIRVLTDQPEVPNIYYKTIFYSYFSNRRDTYENRIRLSKNPQQISRGEVLIIGTKIVENDYIDGDQYIELIKNVCQHFENKKIYYCPHNHEDLEKLKKLDTSIELLLLDIPLEHYILRRSKIPEHIISVGSTAGLTLKLFMNYDVSYLKVSHLVRPSKQFPNGASYFDRLEKAYAFYEIHSVFEKNANDDTKISK